MNLTHLSSKIPNSIKTIFEQSLQSLYSFIVTLVAARLFVDSDFGLFSLLWNVFPICLLIYTAAVTRPLSIAYPVANQALQQNQYQFCVYLQNGLMSASLCFLAIAILLIMSSDNQNFTIATLAISLTLIRLRYETLRRVLIVQFKFDQLIKSSSMIYVSGILALLAISNFDNIAVIKQIHLSSVETFSILIWLLFAPFLLSIRLKREVGMGKDSVKVAWNSFYKYGKDLIQAAVIDTLFKRLAPYIMTLGAGLAEAGAWAAGRLLVGPLQVILVGVSNAALPEMRLAFSQGGWSALNKNLKKHSCYLLFLYVIPLIILGVYAEPIMSIFLGRIIPGSVETLQVYALTFAIMAISSMYSNYLQAAGYVKQQVYNSTATSLLHLIGLGYILYQGHGAVWIAALAAVSEFVTAIIYALFHIKIKTRSAQGTPN